MAKGRRWIDAEIQVLMEMVKEGRSVEEIIKSDRFPHRTHKSIENAVSRLSFESQRKKSFGTQIREAEIVGLETIVARYVDAFNKICDLREYDKADLERFRIIFQAAWKYRELFREYENWEAMEQRVAKIEELLAQLQARKTGEKT